MARIASEADKIVRGNAGGQVHNCALMAKSRWANILVDRGGEAALPGKGGYTPLARVHGAGNCVLAPRQRPSLPLPPPPFLNPRTHGEKGGRGGGYKLFIAATALRVFWSRESPASAVFSSGIFFVCFSENASVSSVPFPNVSRWFSCLRVQRKQVPLFLCPTC